MTIEVLYSKIHRVRVTGAELHYIGSITLDSDLIEAAKLIEGQKVTIVNIDNGERFDTYVIRGAAGSGPSADAASGRSRASRRRKLGIRVWWSG